MRERNLEIRIESGRMVNLQIHTKKVRQRRFVEIKKREHIFAYINSKDHYITTYYLYGIKIQNI